MMSLPPTPSSPLPLFRCNVASLLMVAFQNNLDYATE